MVGFVKIAVCKTSIRIWRSDPTEILGRRAIGHLFRIEMEM